MTFLLNLPLSNLSHCNRLVFFFPKHPKKSFFNVINILSLLPHYNTIINLLFHWTSNFLIYSLRCQSSSCCHGKRSFAFNGGCDAWIRRLLFGCRFVFQNSIHTYCTMYVSKIIFISSLRCSYCVIYNRFVIIVKVIIFEFDFLLLMIVVFRSYLSKQNPIQCILTIYLFYVIFSYYICSYAYRLFLNFKQVIKM